MENMKMPVLPDPTFYANILDVMANLINARIFT